MKNINAVNLLKEVVQQRNWYAGIMKRSAAGEIKRGLKTGWVSYEKASSILERLGYRKVQEEVWEK